jgi:hypothetical protein
MYAQQAPGSLFAGLELIFLIDIVGGGVQLGSTRHCSHQWPIVPVPGDYDDGEIGGMIGRETKVLGRKPAPVPLCPPQTPHAARSRTRAAPGKPATNRLSYGTASGLGLLSTLQMDAVSSYETLVNF